MTIIGIMGAIGSGKSHSQLKYGLDYANKRQKQLVTNFPLNVREIYKYACMPNFADGFLGGIRIELAKLDYMLKWHWAKVRGKEPPRKKYKPLLPWIKRMIERGGGISWIVNPENLQSLMIPESVILLDEAGIFLNSREFAKTPKELLADLAQSRKDGCDLIYCAQFDEQVDKQMRLLTQYFWHCTGLSLWDKKLKRPALKFKNILIFDAATYNEWIRNPKARTNKIKTRFAYAIDCYSGWLTAADRQIFKCFNSFSRLDLGGQVKSYVNTFWQCRLWTGGESGNLLGRKRKRSGLDLGKEQGGAGRSSQARRTGGRFTSDGETQTEKHEENGRVKSGEIDWERLGL